MGTLSRQTANSLAPVILARTPGACRANPPPRGIAHFRKCRAPRHPPRPASPSRGL
ncbi:hypothetical protein PF010_g5912 [Phytophthora fragariae]|uniref:Uncharacterized protein n=1 Tax=Phytophthora fragariae TaxID=53985 RepID=A0A6G0LMY0_9STRA|nr:hypothetical protein PF010_g5912 [Phytophthora fragariae]